MRFTGRPRLIPDEDSTRCMTRSTAGTSWNRRRTQAQPGLAGSGRTPPVKGVGEPCAGEPHARFDGRGLETERTSVTAPAPDPTNLRGSGGDELVECLDRNLAQPSDVDRADLAGGDELVQLAPADAQSVSGLRHGQHPPVIRLQCDADDVPLDLAYMGTARHGRGRDESQGCGVGHGDHLSLIHISEPTRLGMISYAVFCLKKKK